MKIKILSLLLVLFLIPGAFILSACGKDKGYSLSNLKTDFEKVKEFENVNFTDNKIKFKYDNYVDNEKKYLVEVMETTEPYVQLKNYDILFDDIMGFVYENIAVCSSNKIEADKAFRNRLKTELKDFVEAVDDVDTYISQWAEIMRTQTGENGNYLNESCLSRYKTLLEGYNDLLQTSISLTNSLSSLYYNNALNDANPDISKIKFENFDASVVVSKIQNRIKYQISNLSQSFVEMYIDGSDLPNRITNKNNGFAKLDLDAYNYLYLVNSVNKSFDAKTAAEFANNDVNKQDFYNLSIQAYTIQEILDNNYEMFIKACNNIVYAEVDEESTSSEKVYAEIIENNNYTIKEYNTILIKMLACMGV